MNQGAGAQGPQASATENKDNVRDAEFKKNQRRRTTKIVSENGQRLLQNSRCRKMPQG